MNRIILIIITISFFSACKQEKTSPKTWQLDKTINLEDISPIGLVFSEEKLWITDGDNNRLVQVNAETGKTEQTFDNFERPMHLSAENGVLYIPEYGNDKITTFSKGKRDSVKVDIAMDAPAGFHKQGDKMAIADFYNHQVILNNGKNWQKIGKKGKADGEFHYPTDVQIVGEKLFVADAYNNQIQVFSLAGKHLKTIGKGTGLNAATGIFVGNSQLFVTDFENDRVLVFDLEGNLQQIISDNLNKPTDLLIQNDVLYVINYKGKTINRYTFK